MKKRNLKSWAEFRTEIDKIRLDYGYHEYPIGNGQTHKHKNTILFRGQASAKWPLKTTLERETDKEFTFMRYLSDARYIIPELESYTGIKWDYLPNVSDFYGVIGNRNKVFGPDPFPDYEYWVYLRHHGYPSPFLDWSESPYIAAYFAMCDANPKEECIAVFVYIESINSGKDFYGEGKPLIQEKGPHIATHKRHFMQKACYTMALKWVEERKDYVFCSHDEIFDKKHPKQDILIKITIPIADRKLALKELDDYNINHFTLFQTEDSLIRKFSMENFDMG
ncbi:MAG: FRG domain-containing protein [Anaerolineales bacterium]